MDDLTNKLTSILNDPEGMEQIKALAGNILGDSGIDLSSIMPQNKKPEASEFNGIFESISPEQIGTVMKVMQAFNKSADDDRTKLLLALRPHLSDRRRDKLDKAVKLLKLVSVMPAISESGIFKLWGEGGGLFNG